MRPRNEHPVISPTIDAIEQEALAHCQEISGDNRLTPDEYARSSQDFKDLIDTPWNKGEPIYIVPEYDGNGALHPQLKQFMQEIKKGTAYSQFITVRSGALWPLVLRLYYGLGCGFRISMAQMSSMLQVSYCRDAQLESEHIPFFEGDSLRISRIGTALVQKIFSLENTTDQKVLQNILSTQIDPFRDALHQAPKAEQYIQKISLDKRYYTFTESRAISFQLPPHLINTFKNNGLELLYTIITSQNGFTNLYREHDKVYLLLPSLTMLQLHQHVMNPDRDLTYSPKLGVITPQALEEASHVNHRIGNLFAPGITNPSMAHKTRVLAISMSVHDIYYHFYLDGLLCRDTHNQLLYIVTLLRVSLQDANVMTSELRRCTDREFVPEEEHSLQSNPNTAFLVLMKKVFSIPSTKQISPSFLIILVDALLHPSDLPYLSQSLEHRFYKTFLKWDHLPTFLKFKNTVEHFSHVIEGHSSKIAILILCRFYLNDLAFSQALIENMKHRTSNTSITWEKNREKYLEPVFSRPPVIRSLTDLQHMPSIQRIQELAPILYAMPEYAPQKHQALTQIIADQKGTVIEAQSKITHFFMASCLLQAPIRQQLKLDRVKGHAVHEQQIAYLKRHIPGIVIETIMEDKDTAKAAVSSLFTFPVAQGALVRSVLLEWKPLNATKIQARYRGHAIRTQRLFDPVPSHHDEQGIPDKKTPTKDTTLSIT